MSHDKALYKSTITLTRLQSTRTVCTCFTLNRNRNYGTCIHPSDITNFKILVMQTLRNIKIPLTAMSLIRVIMDRSSGLRWIYASFDVTGYGHFRYKFLF